jgi:membrane protein implicated in regulation of membrane protease activity
MQDDHEEQLRRARTQGEFERMLWSVVQAALIAGAARAAVAIAMLLSSRRSLIGLASDLGDAVIFAFVVFLAGFAAVAAVGAPLARWQDKEGRRDDWPFFLLALGAYAAATALLGRMPELHAPWRILFCAPALAAAYLYTRERRRKTTPPRILQ